MGRKLIVSRVANRATRGIGCRPFNKRLLRGLQVIKFGNYSEDSWSHRITHNGTYKANNVLFVVYKKNTL